MKKGYCDATKYQAWVAKAAKMPMGLETVDLAPLGTADVEVVVGHCGLWHNDVSVLNNEWRNSQYPAVLDHEVGRVASVGPGAKGLKIGQRVGVDFSSGSGMHCHQCMLGNYHNGERRKHRIDGGAHADAKWQ